MPPGPPSCSISAVPDLGAQQDVGEHQHRALAVGDALREACPGRFDCTIKIDLPTAPERSEILALLIDIGETSSAIASNIGGISCLWGLDPPMWGTQHIRSDD